MKFQEAPKLRRARRPNHKRMVTDGIVTHASTAPAMLIASQNVTHSKLAHRSPNKCTPTTSIILEITM
eukprot:7430652-Heterocapsa_arctica.AAC.1